MEILFCLSITLDKAKAVIAEAAMEYKVLVTALCAIGVPAARAPLKLGQYSQRNSVPNCRSK